MVGVVALVLIVVSASAFATYTALKHVLINRLDQQLTVTASTGAISSLLQEASGGGGGGHAFHSPTQVQILILTPDGLVVASPSDPNLAQLQLSKEQRVAALSRDANHYTLTTANGMRVRAVAVPNLTAVTTDPSTGEIVRQPVTVVVALSMSEVDNTLARLVRIELYILIAAALVAFLVTAAGVRLSLRPLRRVTETAQTVAAELSPEGAGLQRRVPISATEQGSEAGQLAESMNTLLGAVETQFAARLESEARMRQFLADASHELRTPLTSIRGYAELSRMRHASGQPDTGEDAETLGRIETEGNRMSRLVEDLLMLARGDQGTELHLSTVDLAAVVDDAVAGAQAAYPARTIEVDIRTGGTYVNGDHDQLLRVLRNLITNACVHTAPGGPIRVTLWRDSSVIVQVADAGPGLPPEQAAHVFERFWRADSSRARSSGGSGLGLSIVASIVAAHGGTIHFESTVQTGSTVTVVLPAA